MEILKTMESHGHEKVSLCYDKETGLKAIVAIHDTTMGPALGGCRFWNYASEHDALFDVLRLSRGMTYKAAIAGLSLGGGKSVIIGDAKKLKSEKLFRAFGRFVESMGGIYITAEDVNVRVEDMAHVAKETKYVSGMAHGAGGSGDPSPVTALGVFHGIRASVKYKMGRDHLKGLRVAVQGCGAVGRSLCQLLHEAGCKLVVTDLDPKNAEKMAKDFGATAVSLEDIIASDVDVFAPCALGAILHKESIPKLKAPIVAGASNNQLLDEKEDIKRLIERDILYAPDYVINAGGLINVAHELRGYNAEASRKDTENIYHTLLHVFTLAHEKKISTVEASNQIVEDKIRAAKVSQQGLVNTYNNQGWIKKAF